MVLKYRGRRIRTLIDGFGDRYPTIGRYPFVAERSYVTSKAGICQVNSAAKKSSSPDKSFFRGFDRRILF